MSRASSNLPWYHQSRRLGQAFGTDGHGTAVALPRSQGEPQGYSDVLTLKQTAADAVSGTLTHTQCWWCGSMYGSKTYAADGKLE
jgi:hypothetical protein